MLKERWVVPGVEFRHSEFSVPHGRGRGFSLVELLTVIFIITLLIGILIPSLNVARNHAKRLTTSKAIDSIKVGLELFKNDNGPEFPQTNGYPASYAHPLIPGALTVEESLQGRFPFLEGKPPVTGAHWLPAMLMGVDKLGYIKRSSVPNKGNLRIEPQRWYTPDPLNEGKALERVSAPYVDVNGMRTLKTKQLPGRPNKRLFVGWTTEDNDPKGVQNLPVIVDAFDQPILYYVANAHGRPTNMAAEDRATDNRYDGGPQENGPPYYFHQDNNAFTGVGTGEGDRGWDFGNLGTGHAIARSGAAELPADLIKPELEHRETFARYIVDRKLYTDLAAQTNPPPNSPLRPVNADGFLLISAGVDGRYGTADDVSNLPPWPEQ